MGGVGDGLADGIFQEIAGVRNAHVTRAAGAELRVIDAVEKGVVKVALFAPANEGAGDVFDFSGEVGEESIEVGFVGSDALGVILEEFEEGLEVFVRNHGDRSGCSLARTAKIIIFIIRQRS